MAATGRYRRRKKGEEFILPHKPGKKQPPEVLPFYWHPKQDGVIPAPDGFQKQLSAIDPDLYAVMSPVHERWIIWVKNPRIGATPGAAADLCRGWQLLFYWEGPNKEYLPLTELVFHNLYLIASQRFPNAAAYFDKIQTSIEAQKAEKERDYQNARKAEQKDLRDTWKISTAGKGNKFAMHHDGTLMPGPGEQAWRAETRKLRIPSEQLKRERLSKEKYQDE